MDFTITGKTKVTPPSAAVLYDGVNKIPDRYSWLSLDMAEPNLGIPLSGVDLGSLITGSYVFSSTQTFLLCSNVKGERGWVAFNASEQQFDSEERPDLTTVDMGLEWLLYTDPVILNLQLSAAYFNTGFNLYPGIAGGKNSIDILLEAGMPVGGTGNVSLSWVTNKVDERAIDRFILKTPNGMSNSAASDILTGDYAFRTLHLPYIDTSTTGTSTFYLTAQDWRGDKAEGFINIKSSGPIYYGITLNNTMNINGTEITGGYKLITGSPSTTYGFGNPNDHYLYVAWPMAVNYTPTRFRILDSVLLNQITNDSINDNVPVTLNSGITINYRVFRTVNRYNTSPMAITLL